MRIRMRRLFPRKPAPVMFTRRSRPGTAGRRVLFRVLVVFLILFAVVMFSASRIEPIVEVLARSEAREFVIRAINRAVNDEVENGNLEYGRLVTFEKDGQGSITALVTNSALINIMQTRISDNVVDNVQNLSDTNMAIPIGTALGGVLLSGRGPRIPVKIQSVTNVQTRFTNDFSSAGINQTRHKIMLEISVDIDIIIPGNKDKTTVTTEVAIAETVIVGVVPNVYTDFGRVLE